MHLVWHQPGTQPAHRELWQCCLWQPSVTGWGIRARAHWVKADEGTKDTVNQLDYRQLVSELFSDCCFCNKKTNTKDHNFCVSPFMLVTLEERKKTLPGTMRKSVQNICRE